MTDRKPRPEFKKCKFAPCNNNVVGCLQRKFCSDVCRVKDYQSRTRNVVDYSNSFPARLSTKTYRNGKTTKSLRIYLDGRVLEFNLKDAKSVTVEEIFLKVDQMITQKKCEKMVILN